MKKNIKPKGRRVKEWCYDCSWAYYKNKRDGKLGEPRSKCPACGSLSVVVSDCLT